MKLTYTRRRRPARRDMTTLQNGQRQPLFFGEAAPFPFFQPTVQRKCTACEGDGKVQRMPEKKEEEKVQRAADKKEEEKIQKKEMFTAAAPANTASNYISSINGKGQALDKQTRSFYENRIGTDFSDVKIHTGQEAAASAKDINAQAYTYGNHVVFGEGQYRPESSDGKHLLAHELAHVVQQKSLDGSATVHRKKMTAFCNKPDFVLYNDTIGGIDFRVGLAQTRKSDEVKKYKKKIEGNNEAMAARIQSDNQLVKNPAERVKECYITDTSTRVAIKNGENILIIHPKNADEQTIAHEMGHVLFDFMRNNKNNSLLDVGRTAKFQNKLAEIYTRLGNEQITIKKGVTEAATAIADPSVWGGLAPEHPGDNVDEFFASAKSAFQVDRKRFIETIQKYGKTNANILFAGADLVKLLSGFFDKGELPETNLKVEDEANAAAKVAGIGPAASYEGSLGTSALFGRLIANTC